MQITIEIRKQTLMSACVKNGGLLRLELALGNYRMDMWAIEIDAPEYRRFLPVVGGNWSSTQAGRSYNTRPVRFPIAESDWGEINFIVAVIAGTSDAVGSARLTPTVIAPGNRLVFGPGEIVTTMV